MTNGAETARTYEVPLDFLESGTTYTMTSFNDGINAGRQAMDYKKEVSEVTSGSTITIKMVKNGGFAAVIERK